MAAGDGEGEQRAINKGLLKLPSPHQDWTMAHQGPSSLPGEQEIPSSPELWSGETPGLQCCGKSFSCFLKSHFQTVPRESALGRWESLP